MARPKKNFDKKKFQNLCAIWCTQQEICSVLDTTDKTLDKWCERTYGVGYSECYKKFSEFGKMSLRRAQYNKAVKEGNTSMLIWLGKQQLGQRDVVENRIGLTEEDDALSASLKELGESLTSDDDD